MEDLEHRWTSQAHPSCSSPLGPSAAHTAASGGRVPASPPVSLAAADHGPRGAGTLACDALAAQLQLKLRLLPHRAASRGRRRRSSGGGSPASSAGHASSAGSSPVLRPARDGASECRSGAAAAAGAAAARACGRAPRSSSSGSSSAGAASSAGGRAPRTSSGCSSASAGGDACAGGAQAAAAQRGALFDLSAFSDSSLEAFDSAGGACSPWAAAAAGALVPSASLAASSSAASSGPLASLAAGSCRSISSDLAWALLGSCDAAAAGAAPAPDAAAAQPRCASCGGAPCGGGCGWVLPRFGGRQVLADYEFGRALGRGAFGVTRVATERASARPFACKTICKQRLAAHRQIADDVRSEVAILGRLGGVPGVVQLRGAYEDCRSVNLVLELCAGGDLLDHILAAGRLPEADAAAAARATLLALARCHVRGVVHRDVKPENFLLAAPGAPASVRLGDFGVAAEAAPGQVLREVVGTPYYMAPEVLRRSYDQRADVWSAGVVLFLMLSGELPFSGPTDQAVCAAVLRGAFSTDGPAWGGVSAGAKDAVARMLRYDPAERPQAEELLAHPWLAQEAVVAAVAAAQGGCD